MSVTHNKIEISLDDGWVEVLATAGFVTVDKYFQSADYRFCYSDESPNESIKGNSNIANLPIYNNSESKLWIRVSRGMIAVIPNEE